MNERIAMYDHWRAGLTCTSSGAAGFARPNKMTLALLPALVAATFLLAAPAQAQSMRTYVSGHGKDTNTCGVTAPCRTLQAALAQTAPGGEIFVLNSADYGPVTIAQALTIVSDKGFAGVLVPSGGIGITINAGASDTINLRGLDIDGDGVGASAIVFNSGAALNIQNCWIRGFTNFGVDFAPASPGSLVISNCLVSGISGLGILFQNLGGANATAVFKEVEVVNNAAGLSIVGGTGTGSTNVTVDSSVVANNTTLGIAAAGISNVTLLNSTIANNGIGLEALTPGANLQAAQSTVTGNAVGWQVANAGQVLSSGNNNIGGNKSGNSAPPSSVSTPPPPPPPSPTPTPVANNYLLDLLGGDLLDSNGGRLTAS